MSDVRIFAPATVANVACGFDTLGFALSGPGDEVVARRTAAPGVHIASISGDGGKLTLDPAQNTASVAAAALLAALPDGAGIGVEFDLIKHMPLASGLGSSAASSVAGAVAANELLGKPFAPGEVLRFAMEGERVACGAAHADNAAPCLFGGIRAIRSYTPLDVFALPVPVGLGAVVVHPHCELPTAYSRSVLPGEIPIKTAVAQMGSIASFVAGLYSADFARIGASLTDFIAEPKRAGLIPGFAQVKEAALEAGALGCSISGSGPSVFALHGPGVDPSRIASAMVAAFLGFWIESEAYISAINLVGAGPR